MVVEDTEIYITKERGHVVVYSQGIPPDSDHENGAKESFEHINGGTEHNSSEVSIKGYEMEGCKRKNSDKISDVSNIKKCEEELTVSFEDVTCGKSVTFRKAKGNNKPRDTVKHGSRDSRPAVGNSRSRSSRNVQMKKTSPQPFALATEKRASGGICSTLGDDNKGSNDRKILKKKNVLSSNLSKQNQVKTAAHCSI